MRRHAPFDPTHYGKILEDLHRTSEAIQLSWGPSLQPDHPYSDYNGWVEPEERQELDHYFYNAVAAVNAAVKYREYTGIYHFGT